MVAEKLPNVPIGHGLQAINTQQLPVRMVRYRSMQIEEMSAHTPPCLHTVCKLRRHSPACLHRAVVEEARSTDELGVRVGRALKTGFTAAGGQLALT